MVLSVTSLVGGYGGIPIVSDIDLSVGDGEVVGMLGRNGMGKSTLLGTVFGTVARLGGTVQVDGKAVPIGRPDRMDAAGASFMPEDRGVLPNLTVAENLELARRRYKPVVDPRDVFSLLTERASQMAGTLSGGQQQQLGIARAVLAGSRLICVDELTHGLQPSVVAETWALLRAVAASGVGVLIVDQNPTLVAAQCDRVMVMETGQIVLDKRVDDDVLGELTDLLVLR